MRLRTRSQALLARLALPVAAFCAGVEAREALGGPVELHSLGTLPGHESSGGTALNSAGQVTGESFRGAPFHNYHAFRYDRTPDGGGVMRDLGTLGGSYSYGMDVNASGQVAGAAETVPGSYAIRAFRYDGTPAIDGVMRDLGTLPGGRQSFGHAINASGQVAGTSDSASASERAFLYLGTPGVNGVMHDLGTLGGTGSGGSGINDAGQVVGWAHVRGNSAARAFRYDGVPGSGGMMHDLGTLGGTNSGASDVNASGQVTGYAQTPSQDERAFRYDGTPGAGGMMRELPALSPDDQFSSGHAINAAGFIVGGSQREVRSASKPVLWRPDLSIVDLDAWLDEVAPDLGARWTLYEARDINDAGMITGYGQYNDGVTSGLRAYVLDASSIGAVVPLPAPLLLGVIGFAVAAVTRRYFKYGAS